LILAALVALGYAGALGMLYLTQERLVLPATVLAADYRFQFDQPFEEVWIPVQGASLHALQFKQPNPRGVVFFLHGNVGNLTTWTTGVDFYRRVNYDLFIFDYRGTARAPAASKVRRSCMPMGALRTTPWPRSIATSRS
jgi:uncharacterized protein